MSIYKKLLEVQKEVGAISKDSKNPFFKSKYFDINALVGHVNPILSKNGLLLLQPIEDGKQYSRIIDAESGEKVESFLELPSLPDPQKLGSAISYYRRYSLSALLGLQAEDDDANIAAKSAKKVVKTELIEGSADYAKVESALKGKKVDMNYVKSKFNLSVELESKLKQI